MLFPLGGFAQTKKFQVDTDGTLTTNLVSYYKLEDANDFWSTNNLTPAGDASFVVGKVNNAVTLDGTGDWLEGGDVNEVGATFSLFAWVKFPSLPSANNWVYGKDDDVNGRAYAFGVESAGHLNLQVNGVGSGALGNTVLSANTWYFIGVTFDEATDAVQYFLNGTSDGTTTNTGVIPANTALFDLGRRTYAGANEPWNGLIDEAGVWDKILSATEITDLYNGGAGQTMWTGRRLFIISFLKSLMSWLNRLI